ERFRCYRRHPTTVSRQPSSNIVYIIRRSHPVTITKKIKAYRTGRATLAGSILWWSIVTTADARFTRPATARATACSARDTTAVRPERGDGAAAGIARGT